MLYKKNERPATSRFTEKMIENICKYGFIFVITDENQEKYLAYAIPQVKNIEKIKHIGTLVIAVDQEYQEQGLANLLFEKILIKAKEINLHRLELSVIKENTKAQALYKKYGFEI